MTKTPRVCQIGKECVACGTCVPVCPKEAIQIRWGVSAHVDEEKCVGCKRCLKVACPAVTIRDKKAHIDPNQCVGCTVCAQVCPKGAISRKEN